MTQSNDSGLLSNIINGVANGVGGAIVGGGIGYLIARKQQQRKEIEFNISSISLLGLTPPAQRTLAVTVDKSVLSDNINDKGQVVLINEAYAFEITFHNVGNQDIEKPGIEIVLDDKAKIVEIETIPETKTDYVVTKNKIKSNSFHVSFPYINRGDTVSVTIISVDNDSRECTVDVRGLGIKSYASKNKKSLTRSYIVALSFVAILAIAIAIWLILQQASKYFLYYLSDLINTTIFTALPFILTAVVVFALWSWRKK